MLFKMKKKKTKFNLLPKTHLGKWAFGLIGIFFFFILLANLVVLLQGPRDNQTFFDNLWISIPMFCAGISVILAFLTGLIAIVKYKERAMLVFLITLFGILVLFFILGELLVPH